MSENSIILKNTQQTEKDETPDLIIPLVILIIFIAFIGYITYLLISSGFKTTSIDDPVASDNRSSFTITCATGQCATNIQSGFKTCPASNDSISIDPSQFVCNSPNVCDNPLTPYALQSDGSTNINGICENNTQCPCLRVSQCPEYILSIFTANNGSPYEQLDGQRISFPQESTYITINGTLTTTPPIQFNNPATSFCSVPISWLPLATPGCNFVSAANANIMDYNDILVCQGLLNGCNGVTASPCLQGVLAAITNNPDNLTQANVVTSQFGCVAGESCPCGSIAIFDTNFGNVICRQLQ